MLNLQVASDFEISVRMHRSIQAVLQLVRVADTYDVASSGIQGFSFLNHS
jgi:hypothetical protein